MATVQYKSSLGRYRRYLQSMQNQPLLKASLFLTLSLVLIIVLVLSALRPTLTTIATLTGQIQQQRKLEQQLDAKINTLKEAQQQLSRISIQIAYLNDAIPTSAQISVWSNSLSRVASESGATVTDITIDNIPVAQVSQAKPLAFKVTASGQYGQIYQFLQSLQSLRRLIKLDKLDVSRQNPSDNNISLTINGNLTVSP